MERGPFLPTRKIADVTWDWILSRFEAESANAGLRPSAPPDAALPPGISPGVPLVPAAVLVPLVDRPEGMTVLLTLRTAHLAAHASQISFPGGRAEPEDSGPVETALRETEEEIGLPRDRVEVVGSLGTTVTGSGFLVTPVVGRVRPPFDLHLDSYEVAEAFEVPFSFLLDTNNYGLEYFETATGPRETYVISSGGRRIWGATARILVDLAEMLLP